MSLPIYLLYPFDNTNGNGSNDKTEDWADEVSIFSNDWGSQAATTFKKSESDDENIERLYRKHHGKGNKNRKSQIRQSHIKNDINMYASRLELSDYERQEVHRVIKEIDISSQNFGGKAYEKIILATCSLIADRELSKRGDASIDARVSNMDIFNEIMETIDMSLSEHRDLRVKIREESKMF